MSDEIVIEVAGHRKPFLQAYVNRCSCGGIEDGVALSHWGTREFNGRECEGGWVISFADLERIYLAAKANRSE